MALLTLRQLIAPGQTTKNLPLTNLEIDSNFVSLNNDIQTRVSKAGDTLTGKLTFVNSTLLFASTNIPVGVTPTTPVDGDLWVAEGLLKYRLSGLTKDIAFTDTQVNNAITANRWSIARTLTLSGEVGGSVIIDGSENETITTTVNASVNTSNDSLVRRGAAGQINGSFFSANNGTATDPSFVNSAGTAGIYFPTATSIGISTNDVNRILITDLGETRFLSTNAIRVNVGTTAQRPTVPEAGHFRYNSTILSFEGYDGVEWLEIGSNKIVLVNDVATNGTRYLPFTEVPGGLTEQLFVATTKLFFNPALGRLSATEFSSLSDQSKKENVRTVTGVSVVNQLRGVEFDWKETGKKSSGMIAQELEKVIPHLVVDTDEGKNVNYDGVIAYLIEAIKDLSKEIEVLKASK